MSTAGGPSLDGRAGGTGDEPLLGGPEPLEASPASPAGASAQTDEAAEPSAGDGARDTKRGMPIRLKLTLWYGLVFILAGVILIASNYYMVRNSLNIAPDRARAAVERQFGLEPGSLGYHGPGLQPGQPFERDIPITVNGIPIPLSRLIQEAQNHLRAEALRQLWIRSLIALAFMVVIVFGLAWLLAGRMLRPLHAITNTARRLSGSTLHERINLKGPRDELRELADTFDDMLGRLDTAFTAQREFVANASHELRTPLTIIRTEVDVALSDPDLSPQDLQEMASAITEAVDRSEGLIDGLLVLASADADTRAVMTDLDLSEIAENEVALASAEAETLDLKLELDLQPAPILGDRVLIQRLVGNLVENSIRHNLSGGWFSVRTRLDGAKAVLTVANSGPVLSSEDLERLFDRFYRPDKSRSRKTGGFGLGLSIVKSVVTAHEGDVRLTGLAEGGLEVTVTLPARVAPPAKSGGLPKVGGRKNSDNAGRATPD